MTALYIKYTTSTFHLSDRFRVTAFIPGNVAKINITVASFTTRGGFQNKFLRTLQASFTNLPEHKFSHFIHTAFVKINL